MLLIFVQNELFSFCSVKQISVCCLTATEHISTYKMASYISMI